MMSPNKMKACHENNLELRPFWLKDFSMIQRLHTAMKRSKENSILLRVLINGTEKVMRIFSPITNSLMGLKNIIKKNIFKTVSTVRSLEEPKDEYETKKKLRRFKYFRKHHGKKSKELILRLDEGDGVQENSTPSTAGPSRLHNNMVNSCPSRLHNNPVNSGPSRPHRYNTRQSAYLNECRTCHEDYAACKTCSSCLDRDPTLPVSSCVKCQQKGPVVSLCTKFHNKQPVVHLPDNSANEEIIDKFKQRREMLKEVSKFCKGDSPRINHCPMCSSISPQIGECSCKNCNKIKPIVKITKRNKNTVVEMCPCQNCSRLRPKVKVCEDCKSNRQSVNKAKSYYVILSSK